jgi:hypothetical protein
MGGRGALFGRDTSHVAVPNRECSDARGGPLATKPTCSMRAIAWQPKCWLLLLLTGPCCSQSWLHKALMVNVASHGRCMQEATTPEGCMQSVLHQHYSPLVLGRTTA